MTVCPIALMASCRKCPAFSVCPLKSVLGDHKPDAPPKDAKQPQSAAKHDK